MRFFRNISGKYGCLLAFALIGPLLAGCWTHHQKAPAQSTVGTDKAQYGPFRTGGAIRVDFSGAPTTIPFVDTVIKGDGTIHFEYIGDVRVEGLTPGEAEKVILAKYVPVYYTHLNVTVTPGGLFFYVDGEVNGAGGGRMRYTGQITVTRAIASAGGFSPFANRRNVRLYRLDGTIETIDCIKALKNPKLDLPVYPNDKIVVKRRLW